VTHGLPHLPLWLDEGIADLQQGAMSTLSTQLQKRLAGPELALLEHLQTLK